MNKYYEAYDLRYKRIHQDGLLWFKNEPTPELLDWILVQNVTLEETILEVGCGEGRDALYLASIGYKVAGTDVSEEAISICKIKSVENQLKIEWNREDYIEMSNIELPSYNWIYSIGPCICWLMREIGDNFLPIYITASTLMANCFWSVRVTASLHLERRKKKPSIW